MSIKTLVVLCGLAFVGTSAWAAERVECPATADNWLQTPPWIPHQRESVNHGADQDLVISGRNSFALLAFDASKATGIRIEKATLRVHRKPDPIPLTMVGISTLSGSGPWVESESNYFLAKSGQPWSYKGSD